MRFFQEGYGIYDGKQLTRQEYCYSVFKYEEGTIIYGTIFCKRFTQPHPRNIVLPICKLRMVNLVQKRFQKVKDLKKKQKKCDFYIESNFECIFFQKILLSSFIDLYFICLKLGMAVSLIFILATILIYTFIPELLNLVGKCVICYLACWFTYTTFLICLYFDLQPEKGWPCKVFAYIIYFFAQLTFAWTNVLSFDFWSNFR